jgi:lysozyme family protein
LLEIYKTEYWDVMRGDDLPPGIDLKVTDFGITSGRTTSIKRLQRCIGLKKCNGTMNQETILAAQSADLPDLLAKLHASHEEYYRACGTFWKHGRGWLARSDRVSKVALQMIGTSPSVKPAFAERPHVELNAELPTPPKAVIVQKEPIDSMAKSSTGWSAVTVGGIGSAAVIEKVVDKASAIVDKVADQAADAAVSTASSAADKVGTVAKSAGTDVVGAVVSSPVIWVCAASIVVIIALSAYIWVERRRHMRQALLT